MAKTITALDVFGKQHQVSAHDLKWRPAVYGIVIEDNKVLMLKAFKTKFNLPGGGVDLGEDLEEAVVREVKEETGIDVEVVRLADLKTSIFYSAHDGEDAAEAYHSILLYYYCRKVGGQLSTDGFDEYEQQYAELAEWLPVAGLDQLDISGSVDCRDIIRACS